MLAHTARRNARGVGRVLTALIGLSVTLFSASCDKVPLMAPTGSVITIFATAPTVASNGSMEIVATVIEQGSTSAAPTPPTNGTPGTPTTPSTPTATSSPGAGTPVHNGTVVTFTTTIGRIEPAEARTNNGQVRVTFFGNGQSGTATITAFSGGASGRLENLRVGTAAVERLRLSASPQNLPPAGGSAEIQARPEDPSGNTLPGVTVTFSADFGTLSTTSATTDSNGVASTRLSTTRNSVVTARAGGQEATLTVNLTERTGIAITPPSTTPIEGQPTTIGIAVAATANVQDVIVEFGDGGRTSLGRLAGSTNVSHTYQSDGTFTVTATAIAADGSRESVSTSVTVLPQRPLSVTLTATPRCAVPNVTEVTFTAATSGGTPTGYSWEFGDGARGFSTGPSIRYTYPAGTPPGQKTARVTVSALDAGPGLSETTVTVSSTSAGCTGSTISLR